MSDAEVREFQESDLEPVALLWRRSWISTGLESGSGPTLDEYRDRLVTEGMQDWTMYVACSRNSVTGFLAIDCQQRWLRQLFVSPVAQGAGIGKLLLEVAKREMPDGFWLRTHADNEAAKRFYERQGLRRDGQVPHERWGGMTARYLWP